jgi:hypothetical protein
MKPKLSLQHGAALIVTLAFVAIISALVIGLTETLRTERSAVRTHLERQRATAFAQQGVDLVIARLQQYTVDPPKRATETDDAVDARARHWVSQPGRLLTANPDSTDTKRIGKEVPLTSGLPSRELLDRKAELVDYFPPNLNEPLLLDPNTHLITEEGAGGGGTVTKTVEMPVRWVYVRRDGKMVRKEDNSDWDDMPSLTDKENPVVGRFAFWADDETTKVNYNLAWTRNATLNTQPPGHPTRVELRALPGFDDETANELHQMITTDAYANIGRFFNSPFDARFNAGEKLQVALNQNRFNLTHFNHEPDTTYYRRSRMVLTTQLSNAVLRDAEGNILKDPAGKPLTRPYLDILKRSSPTNLAYIDPGKTSSIDGAKLSAVLDELVNRYLKKSDWPIVDGTGHSLQEKFYGSYSGIAREQRLAQIALNIIDYVRSAESTLTIVEPIRGKYSGNKFVGDFVDTSLRGKEDTFKGLVRGPMITEMGVWVSDKAETGGNNKGRFRTLAFVEVHLPLDYGIDSLDLLNTDGQKWFVYFKEFGNGQYRKQSGGAAGVENSVEYRAAIDATSTSPVFVWDAVGNKSKTVMKPGEYRTLAIEVWRDQPVQADPAMNLRAAFTLGTGTRIDVAPLGDPTSESPNSTPRPLVYQLQMNVTNPFQVASCETNDPRVNGLAVDWKLTQANTFGRVNSAYLASVGQTPANVLPQQDVDENGKISAASFRMPYPRGKAQNLNGRVRSSGELGLIHTGIEGSSVAPKGGTPWRSLRLQPSSQSTSVVPDWAFMDLFTPPVDVPQKATALFAPRGTSAGGRVNMNAKPEPFTIGDYELIRESPLAAVLQNCRKDSLDPNKLVSATEAKTIARNIYLRKLAPGKGSLPGGKLYGAKDKFECYESPGEVAEIAGVADRGEASEELMREIANLITARGNTFAVYTVGQSLQQTTSGGLQVTGEQRQQVLVERYTESNGEVRVGTVYFKNLIP